MIQPLVGCRAAKVYLTKVLKNHIYFCVGEMEGMDNLPDVLLGLR